MFGIHLIWGKKATEEAIRSMLLQNGGEELNQELCNPWPNLWIGIHRNKVKKAGSESEHLVGSIDQGSLLIWDGEIYNINDLRDELVENNDVFIPKSDKEVLLRVLEIYGVKGLERMQGVFSLVYLNLKNQSLLVTRDRNGEKPLYYYQDNGELILSSHSLSIQHIAIAQLDFTQFVNYFYQRFSFPESTFFKEMKEWPQGHYSCIKWNKSFNFQMIESPKYEVSHSSGKSQFRKLLTESIMRQFHTTEPVGILLSGGADSSLLYALWAKETNERLHSYTIEVERKYQKKYADARAAARFTQQFPSFHHSVEVNQQIFLDNWEDYISSVDQPIGDSAGFLTWLVGRAAKSNVKVLATGAGADELWGGYQRHYAFDFYLKHKSILLKLKNSLQKLPLNRKATKFVEAINSDSNHTFLNFSSLKNTTEDFYQAQKKLINPELTPYLQALDFDRRIYLVQDVLKIQDNALRAHGIEGRSPYLDDEMLRFWSSVSDESYLKGKVWIRESLKSLGLNWINARSKLGFGLPLQEWFAEGGEFAQKAFTSIREFEKSHGQHFSVAMRRIAQNPELATKDHFLILYNLFLLGEWVKLHSK